MLALKPGVRLLGIRPETIFSINVAEGVWERYGAELTVTSVMDSKHGRGSEHYTGLAWDGRTKDPVTQAPLLSDLHAAVEELRIRLRADYDVELEFEGTPDEHVHVEFDPKDPY
jgi:hypothetical protein